MKCSGTIEFGKVGDEEFGVGEGVFEAFLGGSELGSRCGAVSKLTNCRILGILTCVNSPPDTYCPKPCVSPIENV